MCQFVQFVQYTIQLLSEPINSSGGGRPFTLLFLAPYSMKPSDWKPAFPFLHSEILLCYDAKEANQVEIKSCLVTTFFARFL